MISIRCRGRRAAHLALIAGLLAACSRRDDQAPPGPAPAPPASEKAPAPARPEQTRAALPPGVEDLPLRGCDLPRKGPVAGFIDITAEAGIAHVHRKGEFDPKLENIMPWIASIGAAAAAGDFDQDGDDDLYLTSSRKGFPNALLRNDGSRFQDVAREAGVGDVNDDRGVSMDAAFADLDNDGDPELYVVQWGRDRLFRNDGGGRFTEITDASGTGDLGNGNCVLPFDHDNDGLLDLLVLNYFPPVNLAKLETTRILHDSFEAARNGGADVLYRNLGNLRFEDVAPRLQLDDTGWSLDAGISDIDNDGDADLYIANDFGQDKVFISNGNGTFADVTERAIGRETFKGMNIDFGDFDGDGFTDAYVTNITTQEYLKEGNMLLLNRGNGTFSNVAGATGVHDGGWGWCGRFFDHDGDGRLDIFTVNGFVTAGPESYWGDLAAIAVEPGFDPADSTQWPRMGVKSLSGGEPDRFFRNRGDGSFEEIAAKVGLADKRDGRGAALLDWDEDGDLDVFVANQNAPGALYRNDLGGAHRFLILSLVGTRSNRDAIGARVQVTASNGGSAPPLRLTREVNGVNGFASQSSPRLHFGLGQSERVDLVTVFWPSGVVQEIRDLPVDRHLRIREAGEPMPEPERRTRYFSAPRSVPGEPAAGPTSTSTAVLALEEALRRRPRNSLLANRYRSACVDAKLFDRSIDLFRALVRERPSQPAVRLQLALALVDKIPFLEGDILAQGSLAKESLNELDIIAETKLDSYAVHYISGMNHLYWPDTMKHFDDAVLHLTKAISLGRASLAAGARPAPHHLEAHRALGDAHVKGKRFDQARAAYAAGGALADGRGAELDAARASLESRLSLADEDLVRAVKDERGLKRRIDSQLSFLIEENGLAAAESALAVRPDDRSTLNAYRIEAFEIDEAPRARAFLEALAGRNPALGEPRLHAALAVPGDPSARDGIAAYRKLSPGDWLGPWLAGMEELSRLASESPAGDGAGARSAAAAIRAFEESAALARRADGAPRLPQPFVALGDARAAAGDVEGARAVHAEVAGAFPRAAGLDARLGSAPGSLPHLVLAERKAGRGLPVDLEPLVDIDGELAALEAGLRASFTRDDAVRYRALVRRSEDRERGLRFLRSLVAESPAGAGARIQLALALMDRTPDPELGSVRKGLLASEALKHLEDVAAAHGDSWAVHYAIGLIHLDWFTKLEHLPLAIASFEKCLHLIRGRERESPHHVLVYRALGDAIVKAGNFASGRKIWKDGQTWFPSDRGLEKRLDLTALMVNRWIEDLRSWKTPQDTKVLSDLLGDLGDLPAGASAVRSG